MTASIFCKPGTIYLSFLDTSTPVTIYRKKVGDDRWKEIGKSRAGFYEDYTVSFGQAYLYRLETADDAFVSNPVWCLDTRLNYGIIQDIYYGSHPSPLLLGRIYSTSNGALLDPLDVISVNYSIKLYLQNDIVYPAQTMTLSTGNIEKEKAITSNPVISPEWKIDNAGYNLRIELPEMDGYRRYLATIELITTKGNLVFRYLVQQPLL